MELVLSNAERRAAPSWRGACRPPASAISIPRFRASLARSSWSTKARCAEPTPSSARSFGAAVGAVFDMYFAGTDTEQIEQWFNLGGTVQLNDVQPASASLAELQQIQGLLEKLSPLEVDRRDRAREAAVFMLPNFCWRE